MEHVRINFRIIIHGIFLSLSFFNAVLTEDQPLKKVEDSLKGKIAHISTFNLTINCNPQQIIKDIKQDLFLLFYKIPDVPVRKYSFLLASALYDARYKLGIIATSGLYLFLFYEVIRGNNYFINKDSWIAWKQDISLVQLLEIQQKKLSQELLLEIQRRYANTEKPMDFISSLIAFMNDIDHEISSLKYFIALESWIKALHINILFPINKRRFSKAPETLNRLIYIRNIFLTWAAQYKIDHNRRYPIVLTGN